MSALVYLTRDQVDAILEAVGASESRHRRRVHAQIYLGFWLGLRAGEAILLQPGHFGDLNNIMIPTLKSSRRVPHQCPKCGRRVRLSSARAERLVHCLECGTPSRVVDRTPRRERGNLKPLPFVESHVQRYIQRYVNSMRPGQKWLFEQRPGKHISYETFWCDFKQAIGLAGLDRRYKPHALRHGRAMHIIKSTGDIKLVQACLRHANTATAEIYVTLSKEVDHKRLLEAAARG